MYTLNCKGKLLVMDKPIVMGIINATPDSFYEGHLQRHADGMLQLANNLFNQGATIIDIGGQSTRPGSERLNAVEEMKRVLPVIEAIKAENSDVIISIDTYYSSVAKEAVKAGASMVNDISGGSMDEAMIPLVASLQVPYICMHLHGKPETMQQHPMEGDVLKTVLDYFIKKINTCKLAGIHDVIIDPGFGFGKTNQQNFLLLKNLQVLNMLNKPVLAGLSRKSTVYKTLHISPEEALNGTTVLNTIALLNGASILRVHDAKEAKEAIQLIEAYKKA
jgi:dihydropteroate synthase